MPLGLINTYELVEGVIVDIDPLIRMLSPSEVPLQGGVASDGRTVLATDTVFEKKYEWQDDTLLTPQSTLGAATDAVQTTITVETGEQLRFAIGDVIQIDTEKMRVTAFGTGDDLDVTRGFAGTTAATHAINTLITNVGAALKEGSDPNDPRSQDFNNRFNFTQIFGPDAVQVSGTEQVIRKYGITTTMFDYQAALRTKEQAIRLEQALIYGTRNEDTTNQWRTFGGMTFFIVTNVDNATTGDITKTKLLDQIENAWDLGGNPNRALMGSKQKRKVSALDEADIRLGRVDNGRGEIVDFFDTDFGRLDFVLHRWMRPEDIVGFNRDQAVIETLRPFQFKMLGDTGDSTKGMIVGEKGFKFEAERWAFRFNALNTV